MEQECKITNRDWQDINQRITITEDNFKFIRDTLERIETSVSIQCDNFDKFKSWSRDDITNIQQLWGERFALMTKEHDTKIGEVPEGKTVMQCIREDSARINKIYFSVTLIIAIYSIFLSPFINPLIRKLFNTNL